MQTSRCVYCITHQIQAKIIFSMQLIETRYWQQSLQRNTVTVSKCQVFFKMFLSHETHAKPLYTIIPVIQTKSIWTSVCMSTKKCLINLLPSHINRFAKTCSKGRFFLKYSCICVFERAALDVVEARLKLCCYQKLKLAKISFTVIISSNKFIGYINKI